MGKTTIEELAHLVREATAAEHHATRLVVAAAFARPATQDEYLALERLREARRLAHEETFAALNAYFEAREPESARAA